VQTTLSILDQIFPQGLGGHRLILAPQQKSLDLRLFLRQRGYKLYDEIVIMEKRRFREILILEQEGEDISSFGEKILERQDPLSQAFKSYLETYYEAIRKSRDRYSGSVF